MKEKLSPTEVDELLLPFLMATDEADSEHLLEQLLGEHARPLIKRIIESKLGDYYKRADSSGHSQDHEDLAGEVVLQLVKRLRQFKSSPDSGAFSNFQSYVAVTTYNACPLYRTKNDL